MPLVEVAATYSCVSAMPQVAAMLVAIRRSELHQVRASLKYRLSKLLEFQPMEQILLIDASLEHAHKVALALRAIHCQTVIRHDLPSAVEVLRLRSVEGVILAPSGKNNWHSEVETLRSVLNIMTEPPWIVGLLPGPYRGADDRVYAARKGFSVVYER